MPTTTSAPARSDSTAGLRRDARRGSRPRTAAGRLAVRVLGGAGEVPKTRRHSRGFTTTSGAGCRRRAVVRVGGDAVQQGHAEGEGRPCRCGPGRSGRRRSAPAAAPVPDGEGAFDAAVGERPDDLVATPSSAVAWAVMGAEMRHCCAYSLRSVRGVPGAVPGLFRTRVSRSSTRARVCWETVSTWWSKRRPGSPWHGGRAAGPFVVYAHFSVAGIAACSPRIAVPGRPVRGKRSGNPVRDSADEHAHESGRSGSRRAFHPDHPGINELFALLASMVRSPRSTGSPTRPDMS